VAAFESGVLAAGGSDADDLAPLELDVLGELAAKDAEALWPVMALYLQSHRERLAARATRTATHAQRMVLALADLYAGAAAPASRRLAAVPLLALVADLPPGREAILRNRALAAARGHDPENAGLLLVIAIAAERHGEHQQAIDALTALRRLDGGNFEAELRLGLNQARQGAERAARRSLRAAIEAAGASPAPPWWLPLAYQELGRLLVEAGDLADAEKVLRQGLVRLPHEEKLSLLLALVLGKRGDREGARAVLAEVAPSPLDRGFDSARLRYMQLPGEPLARARAELLRLAAAARPRLAAALAGTAGSEVGR
jgi:tetratricopeptide (TPR) repeat protein